MAGTRIGVSGGIASSQRGAQKVFSVILRLLIVFGLALAVPACGVKSDLLMPNGKATPKNQKDPSRPPQPIGR
jgi:predicted small lipoprotein YifL